MFEVIDLPTVAAVTGGSDADLIDAMVSTARCESAVMARRLATIAELYTRRLEEQDACDRELWVIDGHAEVAAEVSAALRITKGRAEHLIRVATSLRDDMPAVAEVFANGLVEFRVVSKVVSRCSLISEDEDIKLVDELIAGQMTEWNELSQAKLIDKIDDYVTHIDPVAKKPRRNPDDDRKIGIGPQTDGMCEVWGIVRASDGLAWDAALDRLADTVCAHDPRNKEQRRADAMGSMAAGLASLACQCGREECPVPATGPGSVSVVIQVLAEQAPEDPETKRTASLKLGRGYLPGYGFLHPETLEQVATTAKVRPLVHPGASSEASKGYRPSQALADFVRARDMTCRFPGCEEAAEHCDIDHTVPWPYGPTHPSNIKLLCRHHHLLKTFYDGQRWWRDVQHPDGTVTWTSPTGHTYTTKPLGALFFPVLGHPTGTLKLPEDLGPPSPDRTDFMPRRKHTRAQELFTRVERERDANAIQIRVDHLVRGRLQAENDRRDPPPF